MKKKTLMVEKVLLDRKYGREAEMEKVLFEKRDGLGIITLNEPEKMNGLSEGLVDGLLNAVEKAEKEDDVKVIIITGTGKVFSAGGDITVFDRGVVGGFKYVGKVLKGFVKIEKTMKPVIAAVNGLALGGGAELVLTCDVAIASEKAAFGFPEVAIGIMPGFAVARLHQVIGRTRAKELIMTGRRIEATEAERIGLINRVVSADALMEEVEAEAKLLMNMAPFSLTLAKSIINRELGSDDIASGIIATASFFGVEDLAEGKESFHAKRKPKFKGR